MAKNVFRMRHRPKPPERKVETSTETLYDVSSYSLTDLINIAERAHVVNTDHVRLILPDDCHHRDDDECWCDRYARLSIEKHETEAEFSVRLREYEKKLDEYNKWEQANSSQIKAKKKEIKDKQREKRLSAMKDVQEKEIATLEKLRDQTIRRLDSLKKKT